MHIEVARFGYLYILSFLMRICFYNQDNIFWNYQLFPF